MVEKDKKKLWKSLALILLALSMLGIYVLMSSNILYHPFDEFKGPEYLPLGFNETDNYTSTNERIFEYHGNGTFWVGVLKNSSDNKLEDLTQPFKEDPENTKKTNKTLTINNHQVILQLSEKHLEMDTKTFSQLLKSMPSNQKISNVDIPRLDINMAKFQAIWYCEDTDLTYVATGLVTSDQIPEMEKMIESIKCHKKESLTIKLKNWIKNIF